MEKSWKMSINYLELRRAEGQRSRQKGESQQASIRAGKKLYRQIRKTNSVRELTIGEIEYYLKLSEDVEEDILLRDLAKWRIYLKQRHSALEKLDKLPIDYKNELLFRY
jgi:hypothetical protein